MDPYMVKIYKQNLHESIWMSEMNRTVYRVPGGWIYESWNEQDQRGDHGVFVPFDNEFQETK